MHHPYIESATALSDNHFIIIVLLPRSCEKRALRTSYRGVILLVTKNIYLHINAKKEM